jgi:hypothetical protein
MDEILTFVVLWIVLYLINLVSKKMRKPETGKSVPVPAPTLTQSTQPPVLDSAEPDMVPSYLPEQQPDELEAEDEYIEEEEILEDKTKFTEPVQSETDQISPPIPEEPLEEYIRRERLSVVQPRMKLKQYVIWKEILDKPVSLRNRRSIAKNRVS